MAVELDFLRAMQDEDDDTTRLVFADWLDEHGQPDRAEFIRVQCELARWVPDRNRRTQLQQRQQELLAPHSRVARWLARVVWREPGRPPCLFNSFGMQFALIPAGTFLVGAPPDEQGHFPNETPRHEVTLTRPFHLGVYPVTQRDYATVMGTNPSHFTEPNGGGPNHPVEEVSWDEAVEFCERLSALPEERKAGRVYRLPTEAEWEHACRAGTSTAFSWGPTACSTQANFSGNNPYGGGARGPYLERTSSVGSYSPNAFGLYDLHGNVWEWCADRYAADYYHDSPPANPPGPAEGDTHVLRGGSWYIVGRGCRCAERCYTGEAPTTRTGSVGFRVAMTVRQ